MVVLYQQYFLISIVCRNAGKSFLKTVLKEKYAFHVDKCRYM